MRRKVSIRFLGTLLALLSALRVNAQVRTVDELGQGLLAVTAVDAYGQPVAAADITLYREEDGKHRPITWNPETKLAFGTYSLKVTASGFQSFSETISFKERYRQVFACLRVASIGTSDVLPDREVRAPGMGACKHVVILPMFCSTSSLPVVVPSYEGFFTASGLTGGRYVAVAVSPAKYCGTEAFELTAAGAIVIAP